MNTFFDDVIDILRQAVSQYGSIRKLAEAAEMNPSTVSKWLADDSSKSQRSPNIREISQVLDLIGVRVVLADELPESDSHKKLRPDNEIQQLRKENETLRLELERANAVVSTLREIVQQSMSGAHNLQENSAPIYHEGLDKKSA